MEEVTAVAWSPYDPFIFVTGSDDCHVRLWNVSETGSPVNFNFDGQAEVPDVMIRSPLVKKIPPKSPLGILNV